jgi:hypothetical protein
MKLSSAAATFGIFVASPSSPLVAHAQTCSGVAGPFRLTDIKGTCSYAKILDEYTNQVFNAAGATSCAANGSDLTAKQDLDGKLLAAMPDAASAEDAAMQLCKLMYDSAEIT